jgi:hypothetical protein
MDRFVRVEDVKTDHRRFKGYLDEDMINRLNLTLEKNVPTIPAIPLDRIKEVREEIQKLRGCSCSCSDGIIDDVEDILDKLIESEEEE